MNTLKNIAIGVLAITTLLFGFLYFRSNGVLAGVINPTGPAHEQTETFKQGLQVGQSGTPLSLYAASTCSLQANASIAATSTKTYSCTGITLFNGRTYTGLATDIIDVKLAASTTLASQYVVKSVLASTTANGSVELTLINLTGAAATPAATNGFGSSTVVQIYR